MNYLITFAILTTAAIWCARREGRRFRREAARHAEQHARRDFDKLDALIEATREKPHESYAWGPDADQPIPYQIPPSVWDEWEREMAEGSGL